MRSRGQTGDDDIAALIQMLKPKDLSAINISI